MRGAGPISLRGQDVARYLRLARRPLAYVAAAALAVVVVGAVAIYVALRGSLPQLDGTVTAAELTAAATIERDAFGVATIRAQSRNDLAYATGFAHAQDRFFQMDLMRRSAAGELAALLGASLVDADRKLRLHAFRSVASQVVRNADGRQRELLEAYSAGVNAGLDALSARPWEYLLLRVEPKQWTPEDCVLAAFSMYLSLHESTGAPELAREHLQASMSAELFAFMHPIGTEWDAPIEGGPWRTPPIPSPELIDLRKGTASSAAARKSSQSRASTAFDDLWSPVDDREHMPGSNSWAVGAAHTASGAPLLANDMHLGLRLPNVWYHARLIVDSVGSQQRDLVGVTLPGLPFLIAGSNGKVAWGYTNSYGDWTDLVIVHADQAQPQRYLTPHGTEAFEIRRERIEINGEPAQELEIKSTRWGPIIQEESQGRLLALAWTAHRPHATNLHMFEFEGAASVEELLQHANRSGGPVQNVIAVDKNSNIGWSLMGQLPVRGRYDASKPSSWQEPETGWLGWRTPEEYPRVLNPPGARLWTANNRIIDARRWLELLGEGRYDLGARAAQIRDRLRTLPSATPADMAALQIDDRALFLARWRDLLLELLQSRERSGDRRYDEARKLVSEWSGRASARDSGYRIVRAFRTQVRADVFDMLTASARMSAPSLALTPSPQFEGPLWALVTERPEHFLAPPHKSWTEMLTASFDTALQKLTSTCGELRECTWGQENALSMRHPLSSAVPLLSRRVDMPASPMDGDAAMPRVQSPSFGASQRLVVAPGREAEGLFQMPGGPVNHPLSPFYGAGHDHWVRGESRPLMPGKPEHVLRLEPHSK